MIIRETLFVAVAGVTIALYLGLATHVVTHNPRQAISWVFGGFCLVIVNFYLTSLFLISGPLPPSATPLALRLKWAGLSIGATLFLHLTSFYFPRAWQRYRRWIVPPAYLLSAGLALAALSTDLLVAGPLYRPPPHIIGPAPGPLMYLFFGVSIVWVTLGTAGLVAGYRTARSPSFRRQTLYLLFPVGLILMSSILNWTIVLTQDTGTIPPELVNLIVILIAIFFTTAVVRYGSMVGRPVGRRNLFYSMSAAIIGLIILIMTLTLDRWLFALIMIPYPLVTSGTLIVVAASFPVARRWLTHRLDRLFFRVEQQQREMAQRLAEALAESPDPVQLEKELLGTICTVLDVRGGCIALGNPTGSPDELGVTVVYGQLPLRPGDTIRQPPWSGFDREPRLLATLPASAQAEPSWAELVLFCPLAQSSGDGGLLALGEKRDGAPFTQPELELCCELAKQLETTQQLHQLHRRRRQHLAVAHRQEEVIQQLARTITDTTRHTLASWEHPSPVADEGALEIQLLGSLMVKVAGRRIPDTAWPTEKAKALLAYLLWRGPAGDKREEIAQSLWPDRPVEKTANVFHVTLHHLRRVLEPELRRGESSQYILYAGGRYCFNFDAPHWLDVTLFQELATKRDMARLQEAVALYRGPYLNGLARNLPTEVEVERHRLEQLYVDTLRRLVTQVEGQEVETFLKKLLAVEPADEAAQQVLVLSYLARGRRDLARGQVKRWQQALAEMEVEPSAEARALWAMVA